MVIWLFMTALSTATDIPIAAQGPVVPFSEIAAPKQSRVRFRLVQQPELAPPQRLRRSGMIVEMPLAPKAALGVGVFKVSTRKIGPIDARADGRRQNSRKVGLNFHLQF